MENYKTYDVHSGPLSCMCEVEDKLWIGSENYCFIFNLATRSVEVKKYVTCLKAETDSEFTVWIS